MEASRGPLRATIESLRTQWSRVPHALPQMLCALELALGEPRTVVLAGNPSSPGLGALAAVLHEQLGATILMVTHDPSVAESCERTIHIRDGKVFEDVRR